jgi:hypothetical protein
VFKQRGHLDTFHGYGIQHFLDVDSRFGTRRDLVELVDAAHQRDILTILDIIFNHSGFNWVYPGGVSEPPFKHFPDHYGFGSWLGRSGEQVGISAANVDQGIWPGPKRPNGRSCRDGKAVIMPIAICGRPYLALVIPGLPVWKAFHPMAVSIPSCRVSDHLGRRALIVSIRTLLLIGGSLHWRRFARSFRCCGKAGSI